MEILDLHLPSIPFEGLSYKDNWKRSKGMMVAPERHIAWSLPKERIRSGWGKLCPHVSSSTWPSPLRHRILRVGAIIPCIPQEAPLDREDHMPWQQNSREKGVKLSTKESVCSYKNLHTFLEQKTKPFSLKARMIFIKEGKSPLNFSIPLQLSLKPALF